MYSDPSQGQGRLVPRDPRSHHQRRLPKTLWFELLLCQPGVRRPNYFRCPEIKATLLGFCQFLVCVVLILFWWEKEVCSVTSKNCNPTGVNVHVERRPTGTKLVLKYRGKPEKTAENLGPKGWKPCTPHFCYHPINPPMCNCALINGGIYVTSTLFKCKIAHG